MYMPLQTSLEPKPSSKKNHRFKFKSFVTYHISIARSEETPYSKQGVFVEAADPNVVHKGWKGIKFIVGNDDTAQKRSPWVSKSVGRPP